MALIQLGAAVTGISGKVGGQVYVNGTHGLYLKNKGIYSKAQSISAKNSLVNMTILAQHWRYLTQDNKQKWQAVADQLTKYNRLNESYTPTGYETFMEWNRNRLLIGESVNDSISSQLHSFTAAGADESVFEESTWTVKLASCDTDCHYITYLSQCFSPGSVTKNPSLLIASVNTAAEVVAGFVIPSEIQSRHRPQTLGNGILKPMRAVVTATGQPFHNYVRNVETIVADP